MLDKTDAAIAELPLNDRREGGFAPTLVPEPGFDWDNPEDVVVRHQPAIAVHLGRNGHVVIRQEAGQFDDEDPAVLILPEHVPAVIQALRRVVSELG